MESCQNLVNSDIDIHQKRTPFSDPNNKTTNALTNVLVYCSFYYPHTKNLISLVLQKIIKNNQKTLVQSLQHLHKCVQRQIVYGPSSAFVPPGEQPHINKLDTQLLISIQNEQQKLQNMIQQINKLGIDELFPSARISQLIWYDCARFLSMSSVHHFRGFSDHFSSQLQIDGQSWLQSTPFAYLICFLSYTIEKTLQSTQLSADSQKALRLMWARLAFLHNKILKNPVKKLFSIVVKNYKRVIKLSEEKTSLQQYIQLLLQYQFCLLFYYKYNQSQQILNHCSKLLRMKLEFTGKLGRRTKYQQFDTAQLVMNIKQAESNQQTVKNNHDQDDFDQKIDLLPAKSLVDKIRQKVKAQSSQIQSATYDEQSILLQTPKFVEESHANQHHPTDITEHHLLVSLAILHHQWRSSPHDQMLYQNISAAIMRLLSQKVSTSFCYNFSLLLLRSVNQFHRIKNTERALDQLQKLKTTYNNRTDKTVTNLYSTPYDSHLGFIMILADRYMEIGLSISAVQLFQKAGLYEQCIDTLIQRNYKDRALELLNKLLEDKVKNPRILCMLGDIKSQHKYYQEAWELSKRTNARSQRALGWLYFNKNQIEKAAQSFRLATQASYYHPGTWFTLGCCYMQTKQFEKALQAFSECISIDDTQGEAWGNMASCFIYQKKPKEAFSTLVQAVKYSQRNWKLWANIMTVSLTIKRFYKYFQAIEKLVELGQQQLLTQDNMAKIVQVMRYKNQSDQRRRVIYAFKTRIDRLFDYLQNSIGQNPLVWRIRVLYQIEILQYLNIMQVHYHNLHIAGKFDPNDALPGYETLQQTALTTKTQENATKKRIVDHKQTQLNMNMKVGWQDNKIQASKVKKIFQEYINIYRQYSQRKDKQEFKLFVSGVAKKIQTCLQETYTVSLQWLS